MPKIDATNFDQCEQAFLDGPAEMLAQDDPADDWEEMEDCGLLNDGSCSMAGSEHCDFVCLNL